MGFDADAVPNKFSEKMVNDLLLRAEVLDFYGVDGNAFCIGIGDAKVVLEAIEDESDGYRSYFGCFAVKYDSHIFFSQPIARVAMRPGGTSSRTYYSKNTDPGTLELEQNFSGWVLKDVRDGHVWLTVGTDFGDDYYPCFTFRYEPKEVK
jgi:hypothetical protein